MNLLRNFVTVADHEYGKNNFFRFWNILLLILIYLFLFFLFALGLRYYTRILLSKKFKFNKRKKINNLTLKKVVKNIK